MYELVYTSLATEPRDSAVTAAILATSRLRNTACGVTGLLLFDGRRYVGLLEGSEREVGGLSVLIAADPRHAAFEIRHEAAGSERRFDGCALAYAQVARGPSGLEALVQLQGLQIVAGLLALLPRLQLQCD